MFLGCEVCKREESLREVWIAKCCGSIVCAGCQAPECPSCQAKPAGFIRCASLEAAWLAWPVCPQHGDQLYFFCRQCGRAVCAHDGRLDPLHTAHELVPLATEAEGQGQRLEEELELMQRRLHWLRDRQETVRRVRMAQAELVGKAASSIAAYAEYLQADLAGRQAEIESRLDDKQADLERQTASLSIAHDRVRTSLSTATPLTVISQASGWLSLLQGEREQIPRDFRLTPTPLPTRQLLPPLCRITQNLPGLGGLGISSIFQILGEGMRLRWRVQQGGWLGVWLEMVVGHGVAFSLKLDLLSPSSLLLATQAGVVESREQDCFGWEHYCPLTQLELIPDLTLSLEIRVLDLGQEAKALRRLLTETAAAGGGGAYLSCAELEESSLAPVGEVRYREPAAALGFAALMPIDVEHEILLDSLPSSF